MTQETARIILDQGTGKAPIKLEVPVDTVEYTKARLAEDLFIPKERLSIRRKSLLLGPNSAIKDGDTLVVAPPPPTDPPVSPVVALVNSLSDEAIVGHALGILGDGITTGSIYLDDDEIAGELLNTHVADEYGDHGMMVAKDMLRHRIQAIMLRHRIQAIQERFKEAD